MTHPALPLLSLALAAGVIGLARLRCRTRRAEANAAYWRNAYLSVPTAVEEASTQALIDELFDRVPGSLARVEVLPAPADDGGVAVLRHGVDTRATADLLARAFEKVEGEAA